MANASKEMITIVMPTFNATKTIGYAIASIQLQVYTNWNLIIVDDQSEDIDELEEIVAQIGDPRITLIQGIGKVFASGARNIGMELANGDFIALMDADDVWHPYKLSRQHLAASKAPNRIYGCGVVEFSDFSEVRNCTDIGSKIENPILINDAFEYTFRDVRDELSFQTSTLFFAKSVARVVRFDESLRRHQDYQFLLSAMRAGFKFGIIGSNLSFYFKSSKGLSRKWSPLYSEKFVACYLAGCKKDVLENFFVVQLFGPYFRTGQFFGWLRLIRLYGVGNFSLALKVGMYVFRKIGSK